MLIAIGLHLAGAHIAVDDRALGAPLWRRLQPLAAKAIRRAQRVRRRALVGMDSVRPGLRRAAQRRHSRAARCGGAAAMAAYGLGTLPWLMAGGLAFRWVQRKTTRAVAGGTVLAFGVYGLAYGTDLRGLLCL